MSRLIVLTGRLRVLVWIGIALLLVLPGLGWLDPGLSARWPEATVGWTPTDRLIAWAISSPPMLAVAYGLAQMLVFCQRVREQAAFTDAAADSIQAFGWAVVVGALLLPVCRIALWLHIGAVPVKAVAVGQVVFGQIALASGVGLAIGFALLLFAAILREAARIADENASFL